MTSDGTGGDGTPEARVQRRRLPIIWLVPIAAVAIAGWLGIRSLSARGPLVTITFENAEGLEPGRTRVMLRNVEVGSIESLELARDLSHVVVHARMRRDLADHLTTGTRFWVVRPRLAAGGISGLNTLVSGSYIELDPGKGKRTDEFQGLEDPPVLPPSGDGRTFLLRAESLGSLTRGSPVYYRGVPVGEILGTALEKDGRSVTLRIFVRAPHDTLVHQETRFWNASGVEVSTGGAGFTVRAESLQAILLGGISFETRAESEQSEPSPNGSEFKLFRSQTEAERAPYRPEVSYLVHFSGSVRGLDVGSPVELLGIRVGHVSDIRLEAQGGILRAPITVTLEPELALLHEGGLPTDAKELQLRTNAEMAALVEHGLRAELKSGSLLTGSRVVALTFHPDAPRARLRYGGAHPELPTAGGGDLDGLTESAGALLADVRRLVRNANRVVGSDELQDVVKNLDVVAKEAGKNLGPTLQSLRSATASLERTLQTTNGLIGGNATGTGELPRAVRDLREASRSVRLLTDYLERHPEALLKGKTEEAR